MLNLAINVHLVSINLVRNVQKYLTIRNILNHLFLMKKKNGSRVHEWIYYKKRIIYPVRGVFSWCNC